VRRTLVFPPFIRSHLLISIVSCTCAFASIVSLLLVRDQGYALSADPCVPRSFTPEQIALRRLFPPRALYPVPPVPHNRNTSDSYQYAVPHRLHHRYRYLHPIARPVRCRTSENTSSRSLSRLGFVHDAAFRMGDALVLPLYPMLLVRPRYGDFPFLPFRSFAFLPCH
jgi:hypothetical protein